MPRPLTRWFCRWKPRRTADRSFNVNDAARVSCYVLRSGRATLRTLVARIQEKCPEEPARRGLEDVDALAEAAAVIQENSILLEDSYTAFLIVNGILLGIIALTRLIPGPLRLISPAASAARVNVALLLQRNITQRAANDAMYRNIQQLRDIRRLVA